VGLSLQEEKDSKTAIKSKLVKILKEHLHNATFNKYFKKLNRKSFIF
jgi:hypothetical protein